MVLGGSGRDGLHGEVMRAHVSPRKLGSRLGGLGYGRLVPPLVTCRLRGNLYLL